MTTSCSEIRAKPYPEILFAKSFMNDTEREYLRLAAEQQAIEIGVPMDECTDAVPPWRTRSLTIDLMMVDPGGETPTSSRSAQLWRRNMPLRQPPGPDKPKPYPKRRPA